MFKFRQFSVINEGAALKVGTDAVLLGAAMTLESGDRYLLDIGTGSGVIALMAAQRIAGDGRTAGILGIDSDGASAAEAGMNFAASPWSGMLAAEPCRLQDFNHPGQYDCIFSNPPYYDDSLLNPDARKSAARHEGSLSLVDIAAFASERLAGQGRLSIIIPADREAYARRTMAERGLFPFRIVRIRTTENKADKRVILEFSRNRVKPSEERLTLTKEGKRTAEYTSLTDDFYLPQQPLR